jgi:hypothetical protein
MDDLLDYIKAYSINFIGVGWSSFGGDKSPQFMAHLCVFEKPSSKRVIGNYRLLIDG